MAGDPKAPDSPPLYPAGARLVTLRPVVDPGGRLLQPRGAVGLVTFVTAVRPWAYRVRFPDGLEELFLEDEVERLAAFIRPGEPDTAGGPAGADLFNHLIYRCVIGSRAYGLDVEDSDTDYRGVFLPPAELHWSLYGAPPQIERPETQEQYWELQRFLVLALKANPNVLECLYSPLRLETAPLAEELLEMRGSFLSRLVYQTYSGYVMSQFKKMNRGDEAGGRRKHAMHLIRMLLSGIHVLQHGAVSVEVGAHREPLLAIRRGEMPWDEVDQWRRRLHAEFDAAFATTTLPERPDYEWANDYLIRARAAAADSAARTAR